MYILNENIMVLFHFLGQGEGALFIYLSPLYIIIIANLYTNLFFYFSSAQGVVLAQFLTTAMGCLT